MAQRGPTRPTARIEEAIGFVGMFGILFLGATVFCEVTGRPALGWALTLLVCVLGVVALDRWRVAVLRRHAVVDRATDGIGAAPAVAPVRTARGDDTRRQPRPSADGRVHQHSGWDELAPAGRRAPHRARRTAAAVAQAGPGTAADCPAGVTHSTDG
ncbi:hypothetical protein EDF42_0925 [Curtobacterium sp. PhB172]|uniref:hypothetical protein n=1 Tax=Curtobacterium sp. PhB172 TaxID=2485196 RepID=UPI000F4BF559|nr:hypothetical protein [Curtobacterium sp. PhB172]ROS66905.1 hypothetical protein EDF42_0925 [Curtobacterium sp. PhB172]